MEDIRSYYKPNCQIDSNLMCKICNDVAIDAQECQTCENLFCKGSFHTIQPHQLVREQLGKIQFKCLNQQMGCTQSINMNDVIKHAAECQYKKMICSCGWMGPQSKLQLHEQQCEDKKSSQCKICKEEIKQSLFANHNCVKDLKEKIEKITDKFYEYKKHSEYTIKELKTFANQEINEYQSLKQQIQKALHDNVDLKKQQEALMELMVAQAKLMEEANTQKIQITKGQLADSGSLKCNQGHILQFWVNSQGEEKAKKCSKCNKTQTCCRYLDLGCKKIYCLNCVHPELYSDPMVGATFCPAKHRLNKRIQGLRCSICDKCSYEMKQPGGAGFKQCFIFFKISKIIQNIKNKQYIKQNLCLYILYMQQTQLIKNIIQDVIQQIYFLIYLSKNLNHNYTLHSTLIGLQVTSQASFVTYSYYIPKYIQQNIIYVSYQIIQQFYKIISSKNNYLNF